MSEYEGDDTLDETTAANNSANNSIIGKVRTSVTSILPNSLSKWFSPSTNKTNTSSNGNKRRRNEGDVSTPSTPQRRSLVNSYDYDDDDDDGDGFGNEPEGEVISNVRTSTGSLSSFVQPRRSLNTSLNDEPPPIKRSRMTFDGSMLNSRPLVASTPAVSTQRTATANHYSRFNSAAAQRTPGYNFYTAATGETGFAPQNTNTDIIDLLIPMSSGSNDTMPETNNNQSTHMEPACSRRNLNIPPSATATPYGSGPVGGGSVLKRQSNASRQQQQQSTENNNIISSNIKAYESKDAPSMSLDPALELDEVAAAYNGQVQAKFQNGNGDEFADEADFRQSSLPTDSDIEDCDVIADLPTKRARHLAAGPLRADTKQQQQRTGLFNMSLTSSVNNSRNGSRTSSFGNGLNFDTHLEGRKSLFAGGSGSRAHAKNALGNSTLSLNSLSRRQFNASIYGSTSALSDSRLLNATTSPFYKGNTTYGGAAAYRKYPTATRLTPTLMRPLSSLSTLSSSNNSLAGERGGGVAAAVGGGVGGAPVLSGSAKYIFDALNEMTTPILDAKKMASSLQQQRQQASTTSAGIVRLQQVSKPYMRPTVMLRPKHLQQHQQQQPPIRELQVPSMSQLLTMKKQFQNSTERSRQIAMQKAISQTYAISTSTPAITSTATSLATNSLTKTITESAIIGTTAKASNLPITSEAFSLPTISTAAVETKKSSVFVEAAKEAESTSKPQQQQKHVNKIRHKINSTRNASDIVENEPSLLPVDLPHITFPVMKEMPKIDIGLPPVSASTPTAPSSSTAKAQAISHDAAYVKSDLNASFKFSPPASLVDAPKPAVVTSVASGVINFKFCAPVSLTAAAPKSVETNTATSAVQPLKTGSCLDALKSKTSVAVSDVVAPKLMSFGEQFKKTAAEWECDACMVRNKLASQKCVACETSRKSEAAPAATTMAAPLVFAASSGFGNLFKKQAGEWECDACMLRNKPEANKCVSCETARKENEPKAAAPKAVAAISTDTGFKALVAAQQSNTWECDACMTRNNATSMKCACCEQAKPGTATKATSSTAASPAPKADDNFKAIAAQQTAAKWECEACMTRNESTRTKCVCCEQAKPGAASSSNSQETENSTPKFSFGTTAAAKFSFGFGAVNETELKAKTMSSTATTSTTSVAKTESSSTGKGFTFGFPQTAAQAPATTAASGTASKGFSFGLPTAGKDAADGDAAKTKGFTFSTGAAAATTIKTNTTTTQQTTMNTIGQVAATTTTATAFSFGLPKVTSATTSTSGTAATTSTTTTGTSSSFTLTSNKPAFSFGIPSTTATAAVSSTANVTNTANAFSFGLKGPTTTTAATSSTTTSTATLPTYTLPTNTNAKPLLTFGATPTATTSISAATTTTTTTANNTSFGSGSGFSFPTPAKPLFGLTTTSPTAAPTTTTTTATPTFGGFGSSPKAANLQKENLATSNTTTTGSNTAAATPFGGFSFGAAKTETKHTNLFGFPDSQQTKPIASATPIFGSSTVANQQTNATTTSTPLAAAATWPNSAPPPLFGSSAQETTAPKAVFGSFGSGSSSITAPQNASSSSSIFGSVPSATTSAFGSSNVATVAAFGMPAASVSNNNMPASTPNLFGPNSAATAAVPTVPQFGSGSAAPAPTFGSSSTSTFGGFGVAAAAQQQASNATNTNQQTNVATPFQFGAQSTNTTSFNLGANATARPAFNFTANSQQPSFNFTGSNTESNQNAARPFQFGAPAAAVAPLATAFGNATASSTTSPMVFNFGGAQTSAESNTPFQFSAGNATQPTTNIFAPSPSSTAQSSAAARRRVRVPTRRLTPR